MSMTIHLVTGGARSGKSRYAERLATDYACGNGVTYIATAEAADEEMRERIACHRCRRPSLWHTIEAPHDAHRALLHATTPLVLLDCLTLLAANAFLGAAHSFATARSAVHTSVQSLMGAAAHRAGCLIVVTNEVGFGIVPDNEQGRWFRDLLGEANCDVAGLAATVTLLVAGYPIILKRELGG